MKDYWLKVEVCLKWLLDGMTMTYEEHVAETYRLKLSLGVNVRATYGAPASSSVRGTGVASSYASLA